VGISFFPKIEMKHIRFLIYSDISPGAKFRPFRYEKELKMLMSREDMDIYFPRGVSFTYGNEVVVKDMLMFYSQLFELLLWKTKGIIDDAVKEFSEQKINLLNYKTYFLQSKGGTWNENVLNNETISRTIKFRDNMIREFDKDEKSLPLRSKRVHRQMISKECRIEIYNSMRQSILAGHLSSVPVFAILYMAARIFEEETEENVDFPEDPYENVKQRLQLLVVKDQGKAEVEKDPDFKEGLKTKSIKNQNSVLYKLIYQETNSIWNTLPIKREAIKWYWPRPSKLEQATKSFNLDSVRDFFSIVRFYLFEYPKVAGNQTLRFATTVYNSIIKKIYERYVEPDEKKKVPKDLDRDEIVSLFWDFFDKRPKRRYLIGVGLTDEDLQHVEAGVTGPSDDYEYTLKEKEFKTMVDACLNVINLSDKYRFGNLKVHMFLSGIDVDKLNEKIEIFEGYKKDLNDLKKNKQFVKLKTKIGEVRANLGKIYLHGSVGDTVLDIKYERGLTIKELSESVLKLLNEGETGKAHSILDEIINRAIIHFNRMKEAAGHIDDQLDMENKPFGYFETAYLTRKDKLEKAKMVYYVTKTIE
jgi:hypothetical protein